MNIFYVIDILEYSGGKGIIHSNSKGIKYC